MERDGTADYIRQKVEEGIGTITLAHAARRNALSHGMMDAISAALAAFQQQTTGAVQTIHSEYKSQNVEFNDTIHYNILYGRPTASQEEVPRFLMPLLEKKLLEENAPPKNG